MSCDYNKISTFEKFSRKELKKKEQDLKFKNILKMNLKIIQDLPNNICFTLNAQTQQKIKGQTTLVYNFWN